MEGKFLASPLLAFDSTVNLSYYPSIASPLTRKSFTDVNFSTHAWVSRRLQFHSTAQLHDAILSEEHTNRWESSKQALDTFDIARTEQDKILGRAFGQIHSAYWGEERRKEVPEFEAVNVVLSYLKELGLTNDDVSRILERFPEVLGCSLENELKQNVGILEREWGIRGKALRSLLVRNPRALGYNVDCKGDCMAQCTRCWARF